MDELLTNNSLDDNTAKSSITISLISNIETPSTGKEIISQFKKIPECSVIKYGIKKSPEKIPYAYCVTCDDNLIHPICLECIEKCHKAHNHIVKYSEECDNIVCGCGERLHIFNVSKKKNLQSKNNECPYIDWCERTGLNNLYNIKGVCVCEFCLKLCGFEDGEKVLEENEMLQTCECEEINDGNCHNDLKQIYRKLEENLDDDNSFIYKINPIKLLNTMFMSKNSYKLLFSNFEESLKNFDKLAKDSNFEIKKNFLGTNFYLSLHLFAKVASKVTHTPIRYFCDEIRNKINSQFLEKILKGSLYSDEKHIWKFYTTFLTLYKKVYIGHLTCSIPKFKIYDLENFNPIQRKCITYNNKNVFPESSGLIYNFINILDFYSDNDIKTLEAYDSLIQICGILKRLSEFYFFSPSTIAKFCFTVEKIFEFFYRFPNKDYQLKICFILIKAFHYMTLSYNDDIFLNYINGNKKNLNEIPFIFIKNEAGRIMVKIIIRILFFALIITKGKATLGKERKIEKKIISHGMKILSYFIIGYDNITITQEKTKLHSNEYLKIINSNYFISEISQESNNLENSYFKYYTGECDDDELLNIVSNSLDKVLQFSKKKFDKNFLLTSNYYYIITKIFYILNFKGENNTEKNFISNYMNLLRYFIDKNSDNAGILFSHYIMMGMLKIPKNYVLEIFRLFEHCALLIYRHEKIINFPKHIIKTLTNHFLSFNIDFEDEEDKTLNEDDFNNNFLSLLLSIIIKLTLQTTQSNPLLTRKVVKKNIERLINSIEFENISQTNICLFLIIINKTYDSREYIDRNRITSLINFNFIENFLNDLTINLDFRTEILRYLKKFKFSPHYRPPKVSDILNFDDKQEITLDHEETKKKHSHNNMISNNSTFIRRKSTMRTFLRNNQKITKLFEQKTEGLNDNATYVNAIGDYGDSYWYIQNNPLISNYQFPSKYYTFYYYIHKANEEEEDENAILCEEAMKIWNEEFKKVRDIYEKNSNNNKSFIRYCIKGLFIPMSSLLKTMFCFLHDSGGTKCAKVYDIIMKMLYTKNFIFELNLLMLSDPSIFKFVNFDTEKFLNHDFIQITLEDYFKLKERKSLSPFDYTLLYTLLDKHFLKYIIYPKTLELLKNYTINNPEIVKSDYVGSEIALLDSREDDEKRKKRNIARLRKNSLYGNYNLNDFNNNKQNNINNDDNKDLNSNSLLNNNNNNNYQIDNNNNNNLNEENDSNNNCEKEIDKIFEIYREKKNNLKRENSCLFLSLPEICAEYESNFRKLFICVLSNLSNEENEYQEECFMILYKLLFLETIETQNDMIYSFGGKKSRNIGFLKKIQNYTYSNFVKLFICDFSLEFEHFQQMQISIFNNLKILKYLCEQHNSYFQVRILRDLIFQFTMMKDIKLNKNNEISTPLLENNNLNYSSMTFFNFLINSIHKILIITKKASDEPHIQNLYDILHVIIDLLIEIIQGNKSEILIEEKELIAKEINENTFFIFNNFVQISAEILFDESMKISHSFKTRLLLMSFLISIIEEKNNNEIKKIIIKYLAVNKVLNTIITTLKYYFYQITFHNPNYQNYYSNYSEKQIEQRMFIFDYTVFEFFQKEYFHSEFSETDEFSLTNSFYKYIKLLSINEDSPDAEELIKNVQKVSLEESKKKFEVFNKKRSTQNYEVAPINLINEKQRSINIGVIESYYCISFFELITKVVEIRIPSQRRRQKVIFTIPNDIIHLSKMSKEEFTYNVDRSSESSKKNELLRTIPLFIEEINYFKNVEINWFSKLVLSIDYIYIQIFVYMYAVVFNIFIVFTLKGYTQIEVDDSSRRRLRNLINIEEKFSKAIDESIKDWGNIYDLIDYIFCALNGILILSWIIVKLPLYYQLDSIKYCDENNISQNNITFWTKIKVSLLYSIYNRGYINTLIYMFIVSLIGISLPRGEILYCFFLLAIVNLNPTLKGIAVSIKLKGIELFATLILLVILVYFYSNIGFFFFNKNYATTLEDQEDNFCSSLVFCFLTNIDAGIRARGGTGDMMIRVSYERNLKNYILRVFFDVTYFIICIIIMIDLVFGIILGTFAKMREQERIEVMDKINHCFICDETRSNLEKNKEDFHVHTEITHNLWNYTYYMIYLKNSDLNDLNSIDTYVRKNLDEKSAQFLPSWKDNYKNKNGEIIEKEEFDSDKGEEEESEEIEDEMAEKDEEYLDYEDNGFNNDDANNIINEKFEKEGDN